jgi:ribosomal protein S18 acetylase RimI-like enzyme
MAIPDDATIIYRTASEADFDTLARLWLESWQSTGLAVTRFATEEGNRKRISLEVRNGWKVTLALAGQQLVGFLATEPAVSVLDQLFIAPDMKRKGIGKALLARAKAEMPDGFTLRTAVENFDACAFYERCGLERVRTEIHPTLGHAVAIYRWRQRTCE